MANPAVPLPRLFRFGPYELDERTGELRNGGVRLKIGSHASQILLMLLDRPGEAIFREEIRARLWPNGIIVEFDSGINTAVRQLRSALNDSAENPQYIETVSRRGYRFLAEVESVSPAVPIAASVTKSVGPMQMYAIAAGLLLVIAGGMLWWWQRPQAKLLTDQDVLVLTDFTNTTGDAVFDGALRQALAFELEKSPFLKTMDDQEVNQTLQLMGRSTGERITNEIAHEVCVREGQKVTIGGSIASLGKTYQIALQAINCQSGATLAREQAVAEDKEHVLDALAKTAMAIRSKLGESLSSIQKPDRHSAFEVTTHSLEALKAYQLGWNLIAQNSPREAIAELQHATELDPNFASAYMFLEIAYRNAGQPARADEALEKAFALIDRVGDRERVYISGRYYQNITHEMNKAVDAYQLVERTYPRFAPPHNSLFNAYANRGEYEKALREMQVALQLEPRNKVFIGNQMRLYTFFDRFEEAKVFAVKMLAQKLDEPELHYMLLVNASIQNDRAAQEQEIQWFAGKPDDYLSFGAQADNAMLHGQRRKAKELYQRAFEIAPRQHGAADPQPPNPVVIDAQVGDCEGARKEKLTPLLALCGDASALRLVEEAAAKNPPPNPDALVPLYQRGLLELNAGKGAEAAAEFQKILEHKGRNWRPYYSTAYLFLARAETKAGDTTKAKRAYREFLTLWKDADKDLPFLNQATKELAEFR